MGLLERQPLAMVVSGTHTRDHLHVIARVLLCIAVEEIVVAVPSPLVLPVTQQQIPDVPQLQFPAQKGTATVKLVGLAMEHVICINIPSLTMQMVGPARLQVRMYVEGVLQRHLPVQEQVTIPQDFL